MVDLIEIVTPSTVQTSPDCYRLVGDQEIEPALDTRQVGVAVTFEQMDCTTG